MLSESSEHVKRLRLCQIPFREKNNLWIEEKNTFSSEAFPFPPASFDLDSIFPAKIMNTFEYTCGLFLISWD